MRVGVCVRVNGEAEPKSFMGGYSTEELRCKALKLGATTSTGWALDVSELCLLDRVLTDDEIAALAGKKELPNPKK
jgi:hypothetical protein